MTSSLPVPAFADEAGLSSHMSSSYILTIDSTPPVIAAVNTTVPSVSDTATVFYYSDVKDVAGTDTFTRSQLASDARSLCPQMKILGSLWCSS